MRGGKPKLFYDIGDSECLTRSGYTQQGLLVSSGTNAVDDAFDRLWLVACRLEWGNYLILHESDGVVS